MNNKKITVYRYMDNELRLLREEKLKKFLIENKNEGLSFVDLDMYSPSNKMSRLIRQEIYKSKIYSNITLTRFQIEILNILEENNLFLSAPTSFGKTFLALEYLARNIDKINNVVFIIPTIALMNELLSKLYDLFSEYYNICINSDENIEKKNIFVFVPERSDSNFLEIISSIELDLLIFDELYKLRGTKKLVSTDDRLIYMNKVYLDLITKAKKIILLGPYINDVNFDKTKIEIVKFYTNFMPVYNKMYLIAEDDNWENKMDSNHNLVYFKSPQSIYKKISKLLELNSEKESCVEFYKKEIDYLETEVGNEWYVINLLKRGIGIHHGKTPIFLRKFYENEYNNGNINTLLCTNTLMEGINTPTDSLIVVDKPNSPFEFNNLIGRVGRLNPSSPIIGKVLLCDESILEYLSNTESWLNLSILAESDEVYSDEEILYLNKEYKDEANRNEYTKKMEFLSKEFSLTKEILISHNVEFGKTFKLFSEGIYNDFLASKNIYECIIAATKLIPGPAYYFAKDNFHDLNLQINYLPYKTYINDLMYGKSFREIIKDFNSNLNLTNNIENVNILIDGLYLLNNYIKFKFSKIVNYLELINNDTSNKELNKFISIVSSYNSMEVASKLLDDLGINNKDAKVLIEKLNITNSISASKLIKILRQNKDVVSRLEEISPFTKNNIANL